MTTLTLEEKRSAAVAIAKDVIEQLDAGNYNLNRSVYFESCTSPTYIASKVTEVMNEKCEVCAIGACVISAARLYNHETYEAIATFNSIFNHLSKFFDEKDIRALEYLYELGLKGDLAAAKHNAPYDDGNALSACNFTTKEVLLLDRFLGYHIYLSRYNRAEWLTFLMDYIINSNGTINLIYK